MDSKCMSGHNIQNSGKLQPKPGGVVSDREKRELVSVYKSTRQDTVEKSVTEASGWLKEMVP